MAAGFRLPFVRCGLVLFLTAFGWQCRGQVILFDINAEAHTSGSAPELWAGSALNPSGVYLATAQDFADAGVTGDLSGATLLHGNKQNNNNNTISDEGVTIDISIDQGPGNAVARPWVDTSTFVGGDNTSNLLLQDYVYLAGNHGIGDTHLQTTITISGLSALLSPDSLYSLYLFGAGDIPDEGASFTFGGLTLETPLDAPPAREDERFALFQFSTGPSVGDELTIQWDRQIEPDGSDRTFSAFNGFAITPVPEPATWSLILLGGGALLWRRFRS